MPARAGPVRRDLYGLLVTLSLVVLTLTLVSTALTTLTSGQQASVDTGRQTQAGPSGFLEATLVHTDLGPTDQDADSGEDQPRCVATRTVRTTYRPVVLLNRSEMGCGSHERVDLTLYVSARPPVELLDRWMAVCHLDAYRLVQAPSGPMIGPKGPADCRMLELAPMVPGPTSEIRVDGHVAEDAIEEDGLHVACAVAKVQAGGSTPHLVADMTWFEVWDLDDTAHHRDGHLQSQAADIPCERLGLEMPAGWPADVEDGR